MYCVKIHGMKEKANGKKRSNFWLRMLPFIMWLLPLLALNVGFRFLARIEQSWKERELAETAQQELEALTRSSTAEYRLNRFGGQIIDKLTVAGNGVFDQTSWQQLQDALFADIGQVFPDFKLHVFGKVAAKDEFAMLYARSDKVESRRGMGMLFNHLVDQHKGLVLTDSLKRQRDKIAENYFGVGISTDAIAGSMKGRTCNILHGRLPHWFVWDYYEKPDGTGYGYMMTAEVLETTRVSALQAAAEECQSRGNGVGAFIPVLKFKEPVVGSDKLTRSGLFRNWREKEVRHLFYDRIHWMENGPPAPTTLGRYRIYSHLGTRHEPSFGVCGETAAFGAAAALAWVSQYLYRFSLGITCLPRLYSEYLARNVTDSKVSDAVFSGCHVSARISGNFCHCLPPAD